MYINHGCCCRTADTELIGAFEERGYVAAFDVIGNGGLSDSKLKEIGLTKMCIAWIINRLLLELAGGRD